MSFYIKVIIFFLGMRRKKPSVLCQDVPAYRLSLFYPVGDLVSGFDVFLEILDNDDPCHHYQGDQYKDLIHPGGALEDQFVFLESFHTVPRFQNPSSDESYFFTLKAGSVELLRVEPCSFSLSDIWLRLL